jgi:hypothetical protein
VGALGVLACNGSTPSGPDAAPSGPRIVPWQLETDGAPPLVLGSYDTREKVHCRFRHDENGVLRCLPPVPRTLAETNAFADPACQTRVYAASAADVPALLEHPVTVPLPRVDCEPRRHVVATLVTRPAGSPLFGGTPCAPLDFALADFMPDDGIAIPSMIDWRGELVVDQTRPSDRWATGTEVDGPLLQGRVRVRQVEAGSARFHDHLVDETLGKACRVYDYVMPAFSCIPARLGDTLIQSFSAHEGTDCMGPLAWSAPACTDPAFVDAGADGTYALGPKWAGPVSNTGQGCQVNARGTSPDGHGISPDGMDDYYEQGPPIAKFVPAVLSSEPMGTGRLQLRGLRADDDSVVILDGEIVPAFSFSKPRYFDTVANQDCDPVWTPEGRVRCIPTTFIDNLDDQQPYYADPACTVHAIMCYAGASCEGSLVLSATGVWNGELHGVAVRRLGPNVSPGFFVVSNVGCAARADPGPGNSDPLFAVGADALPWDSFPELNEINAAP